ncbi:helix-turn-helix transcriptional regulator [Amycolatopsis sp. DSM 110486]|uniref:helix-turn-helix transcriptional regulator n=1 Tax=Amycolatopsis sp. DSM 110486 TaxID=2865832 RepID=UPI001C6A76A7|nr:AAA family ATPase [Amycolatopsis sp. DSM 110486]QYN25551.1 AAA family ATPase [Amycolatopsis sp. DSM 110486]
MTGEYPRTSTLSGSDVRSGHTLRGRSAELGLVLEALRTVQRGRPAVIVLSGEPGIGKTALLRTVVEQAGRLGFRTAHSAAHEDDRVTPLASLGPALRFGVAPLIGSADFMDLAGLHEQPLWLVERLATLVEQQDGPVLLAIDDAQWCDPLTGFALRVLPKRLLVTPIAWVLASRPVPGGGPAEKVAEAAAPDLPVTTVELTPLSRDAVLAVAADRLGAAPDADVLRRLTGARGNPFLTVQLLEGLFEPGAASGGGSRVPSGLLEGVRRRLAATSAPCRELMRIAAVVGPSFLLSDAAALLGSASLSVLTEPLIEAIDAGLLADDGTTVHFRHELLRDAVYEDLPPSSRHAMHRAFADRLLAGGRGYAAAAPHVLATATRGDAAAADVLRRAAYEVLAKMAVTSVTFIREAFALTNGDDPAWGEIGAETVAILGSAHQYAEATRFADLLLAAPLPADLHARVRLLLLPRLWATGQVDELADRSREPSGVPELDARLAGYRALAAGLSSAPDGASNTHRGSDPAASGTATQPGGDPIAGAAVAQRGAVAAAAGPIAETATTADDPIAAVLTTTAAAQLAGRAEDRRRAHALFAAARVAAQGVTGYGAPETGQLAAREMIALARTDDIDRALRGLGDETLFADSWQAPQLALIRAQLALGAGRVNKAASAAATAAELMAELHNRTYEPQLRELLAILALLRGDNAEARTHVSPETTLARALLADADGDPRGAAEIVAAVRTHGALWPEDWLVAAACTAHHRGDTETVHASAALLADLAERNPDVRGLAGAHLLVQALSTADFAVARKTLQDSPRALLSARADEEFGRFALDTVDRPAAIAALDTARDRYAELGATASATRVQRILQAAGVRRRRWAAVPQRPGTGWDALTDMERRVAVLIADGHTNRSAAEELVLSPSTISTHLRAVFGKLDVHSRVQLANLVVRKDKTL